MKKLLVLPFLVFGLSACANTTQGKLKQGVYTLESSYHVAAVSIPDINKAVGFTDDQKTLAKQASQLVFNQINALQVKIDNNESLTPALITKAETAFENLKSCISDLKNNEMVSAQLTCIVK